MAIIDITNYCCDIQIIYNVLHEWLLQGQGGSKSYDYKFKYIFALLFLPSYFEFESRQSGNVFGCKKNIQGKCT